MTSPAVPPAGPPAGLVVDTDGRLVTPEVARLYRGIRRRPVLGYDELGVEAGRAMVARSVALQGDAPAMHEVVDLAAGATGGCPVRLYRPQATADVLLVHVHGGGWVTGDLESTDATSRQIAASTGAVVATLDYPLSPEAPSPAPQGAVEAALRSLAGRRGELGVLTDRLVLLGDSAGAYLACAAALAAPGVASDLVLLYPVVRPPGEQPGDSWAVHADDPILSAASMRWFWTQFAGAAVCHASDGRTTSLDLLDGELHRLPRTFIATAGLDVLHDEGRLLVDRMRAVGVEVRDEDLPGVCHGFLALAGAVPPAAQTLATVAAWLRG